MNREHDDRHALLRPQPARARHRVSTHESALVESAWQFVGLPPEAAQLPAELDACVASVGESFRAMPIASGIAAALNGLGELSFDAPPDLDGRDWWMRCELSLPELDVRDASPGAKRVAPSRHLVFDGLATIVDVWLNGRWLGRADDMFVSWEADVTSLLGAHDTLVLCARALTTRLAPRRPRARWRSNLLTSQEWRWHRTTQMGRMPGFGPQVPLVGPWRPIRIETRREATVRELKVVPSRVDGRSVLRVDALVVLNMEPVSTSLSCGAATAAATVTRAEGAWRMEATLESAELAPWCPHTHGEPALHDCALHIESTTGERVSLALGPVGFRELSLDTADGRFALSVNGQRPFLRGSCWTPRSWLAPENSAAELENEMRLLRGAGVNCIRMSGCFTYASEEMLAACDRHGIVVWHDLMFSVLDYPSDEAFAAKCEIEVAQQTALMQSHPCVVTICGSAEVDQQAAMTGVALAETRHPLFHERLAATVRATLSSVPYWPSTPSGGVVPFRTDTGTAHYFGVGAYERDLDDARRSAVRFTTECLAFSHLPEPESPAAIALDDLNGRERWKARVPRDGGVDWDFEDTRDFYVGHLFGVDPARLRRVDPERYLALGRAATAIVVERTMQELRRIASPCQGAITWLWADPWAGAGWGYVDATGRPKASWFGMRRALRPVALALTNEGMNGVDVHAWNDRPERMEGTLHVRLLRDGREVVRAASCALSVEGGQGVRLSVEEVLGHFVDVAHSYRFGPPSHDAVHAVWVCDATPDEGNGAESSSFEGHAVIDDAVLLVHGDARATTDTGLRVQLIDEESSGDVIVSVTTSALAQMIRVGSAAYRPSESYFTLVPGVERRLRLALIDPSAPRSAVAEALNDVVAQRVTLGTDASAAGAQSAGARSIDERRGASSLVGDAC